jgi:hypothetical protein
LLVTIAILAPRMRLSRVDLPTFGRPRRATKPDFISFPFPFRFRQTS